MAVGVVKRVLASLPVLLMANACTLPSDPEAAGRVGLTRDSKNRLVAVVAVCRGHVDGLTLYRSDTDDSDDSSNDRGRWEHTGAIESDVTITLAAPEEAWTPTTPLQPLEAGHRFTIGAGAKNGAYNAPGPTFETSDLSVLKPGRVLFDPSAGRQFEPTVVSLERFRELACAGMDE